MLSPARAYSRASELQPVCEIVRTGAIRSAVFFVTILLGSLKAIVDAEAGKRSQPNLGAMSEQEFQAYKSKHGL